MMVVFASFLLIQDWGEKDEGGWRKRTEGNDSDWRRPGSDRFVSLTRPISVLRTMRGSSTKNCSLQGMETGGS